MYHKGSLEIGNYLNPPGYVAAVYIRWAPRVRLEHAVNPNRISSATKGWLS